MISEFKGPYIYSNKIVSNWNSSVAGVYYIGIKTPENQLSVYYIGQAVGELGIRGRLLQHLSEAKWSDATHFGFQVFDKSVVGKITDFEKGEIVKFKPKYNINSV